jgi:quercetin dioxygenase-like cupin family protein
VRALIVLKDTAMTNNDKDLIKPGLDRRSYLLVAAGSAVGAVASTAAGGAPLTSVPGGSPSATAIFGSAAVPDWFEAIPGERMRIRIGDSDTGGILTVLESVVAPKTATPLHYHAADEMFLIMSGRLRLICGGKAQDLAAGSSAVVPGGAHHGFVNLSGEPVRMLAIFSPGGMEQLFIQLHATPPEQWGDLAKRFDTFIVGPPVTG